MGIKDMVKDAAKQAVDATQSAVQNAMDGDRQSVEGQGSAGVVQGMLGNYSELPLEIIEQQYGMYLMDGECFKSGFALIRDKLLFTDRRIIFVDHQGATGKKVKIESIFLDSIVSVELETAGFGFDHAELEFAYITSPYHRAFNIETSSHKFDFPKNFDVQALYGLLQGFAYENIRRING